MTNLDWFYLKGFGVCCHRGAGCTIGYLSECFNSGGSFMNCTYTCDDCQCIEDITENGTVDVEDLLAVITAWGSCPQPSVPPCPANVAQFQSFFQVNVEDLLAVIEAWGPCR
jgi:hypothetical protein